MEKSRFAIIGVGNGGQSFAAHLSLLGFSVGLLDVEHEKVQDLRRIAVAPGSWTEAVAFK